MSAVTLASLVGAVVALAVTTVALRALRDTRRSLAALEITVRKLQPPLPHEPEPPPSAAPASQIAVRPVPYAASPVLVPRADEVWKATMERPVVRLAALSYGLRRALRPQSRDRIAALVRREFRRRRKIRARAGRMAARMAHVERPARGREDLMGGQT